MLPGRPSGSMKSNSTPCSWPWGSPESKRSTTSDASWPTSTALTLSGKTDLVLAVVLRALRVVFLLGFGKPRGLLPADFPTQRIGGRQCRDIILANQRIYLGGQVRISRGVYGDVRDADDFELRLGAGDNRFH